MKARRGLVPIGEVIGDDRDALVAERLRRVFAERVVRLRRGADGAHEPGVGLALREVLSRRRARHDRRARRADVVVDGERLERGERPDQHRHLQPLDQLLRLGARLGGIAAGVGDDELDLAAGDGVVALLEKELDAFFHLLAAGGERAGAHGQETDPDRLGLRVR